MTNRCFFQGYVSGLMMGEARLPSSGSEYKLLKTFIKAVSYAANSGKFYKDTYLLL